MPIFKMKPEWMLKGKINLPSVNEEKLPDGKSGNMRTLQVMSQVAHQRKGHPLVRRLALAILEQTGLPSHHHLSEAVAIGQFVQSRVRYIKDGFGVEQLHDPVMMIDQIERGIAQGDCDDMVLLTASLLMSVGIYPKFRCVRYRSNFGHYNHIYLVVYESDGPGKKERLVIDPIVKNKPIGFEVPHRSGREYYI